MRSLIKILHKLYKNTFSLFFGNTCRFHPSCSDYSLEAIEKHGLLYGLVLSAKRLIRCQPFSKGWIDLVPENPAHKNSLKGKNGR